MPRKPPRKTRKANRKRWASWPDERLLKLRLKDLKLTLRGNGLAGRLRELNAELADTGLRMVLGYAQLLLSAWVSKQDIET